MSKLKLEWKKVSFVIRKLDEIVFDIFFNLNYDLKEVYTGFSVYKFTFELGYKW